jgi:CRP-like cAMP-binding protein
MTLVAEEDLAATAPPQSRNHLLAVLPPSEFLELRPHLTTVRLPARARLAEPNLPIEAVYFPLDTVISVSTLSDDDGDGVEVGSVGCEGMAGLPVFFGAVRSTSRITVQIAGEAERMEASVLQREAGRHDALRRLLHLYAQGFMTQIAHSTACNRLHAAEERLARWLLICRDRLGRDDIPITHETMAAILGVRRATVTEAAGSLQRDGLIRYRRGTVSIVDRQRLEAASCACYAIVREEFSRLLGVRVG